MSYCRWSSMDFGCDLYCYEGDQGYMTHVAVNRVVGDVPKISAWRESGVMEDYLKEYKAQNDFLEVALREPIGLPYDGVTFCDSCLEDFMKTLQLLRKTGYIFPDYVLEGVQEEIDDQ